jgi:hypothetical protein
MKGPFYGSRNGPFLILQLSTFYPHFQEGEGVWAGDIVPDVNSGGMAVFSNGGCYLDKQPLFSYIQVSLITLYKRDDKYDYAANSYPG